MRRCYLPSIARSRSKMIDRGNEFEYARGVRTYHRRVFYFFQVRGNADSCAWIAPRRPRPPLHCRYELMKPRSHPVRVDIATRPVVRSCSGKTEGVTS